MNKVENHQGGLLTLTSRLHTNVYTHRNTCVHTYTQNTAEPVEVTEMLVALGTLRIWVWILKFLDDTCGLHLLIL